MATKYTNTIDQHRPLHLPKFTQIGIFFGLKIYHLATLQCSARLNIPTQLDESKKGNPEHLLLSPLLRSQTDLMLPR
jgi:hypothetical protein